MDKIMSDLPSSDTRATELQEAGAGSETSKANIGRRGLLRTAALLAAGGAPIVAACSPNSKTTTGTSGAAATGATTPTSPKPASGETAAHGYAVNDTSGNLSLLQFQRRAVGPNDVRIDIKYCGVCHSDIHYGHGDWGPAPYPTVPGHEVAGIAAEVGTAVTRFKPGDQVAVGPVVDSCGHCAECVAGSEQYCLTGRTDIYGTKNSDPGGHSQGGYATSIVVRDRFVLKVPQGYALEQVAPITCSGATVYSPMRAFGVREGTRVGILGVGGLGHFAIQIAKKLGAEVVAFTTSPDKAADATKFGASTVVVNNDREQLDRLRKSFDFILDTIPYAHDLEPYYPLLNRQKVLCRVGIGKLETKNEFSQRALVNYQALIAGSDIAGVNQSQEIIDFCAANKIGPQTQVVPADQISEIWKKVFDRQARYRYVIDASTIKA